MIDKMVMKGIVDTEREAPRIIRQFHLEECTRGEIVYYQSSRLANIDGIHITLNGSRIVVKCSIHKLWSRWDGNGLDNSRLCRYTEAIQALRKLLDDLGIDTSTVRVTYYEIGVNLNMKKEPLDYIRAVSSVGAVKEMFNDANFEKNRQKTTEKSRNYKKVQKIYDKTFEATEKGRTAEDGVLRVETIYKRQGAWIEEFFDFSWYNKMLNRFYQDWSCLCFERDLVAAKGVRASQTEKAKEILKLGRDGYLETIKRRYSMKSITAKNYRVCREFCRDWEKYSHLFTQVKGALETEYQGKLLNAFQYVRN